MSSHGKSALGQGYFQSLVINNHRRNKHSNPYSVFSFGVGYVCRRIVDGLISLGHIPFSPIVHTLRNNHFSQHLSFLCNRSRHPISYAFCCKHYHTSYKNLSVCQHRSYNYETPLVVSLHHTSYIFSFP